MTAVPLPTAPRTAGAAERPHRSAFGWAVADTKTIAWRNLLIALKNCNGHSGLQWTAAAVGCHSMQSR